jgi:hypothetical protein
LAGEGDLEALLDLFFTGERESLRLTGDLETLRELIVHTKKTGMDNFTKPDGYFGEVETIREVEFSRLQGM